MDLKSSRTYKPNGPKIEELRQSTGLSQRECAKLAGISFSQLQRIEKGEGECFAKTLAKVAKTLNVKWTDITFGAVVKDPKLVMQLTSVVSQMAVSDSPEERTRLLGEHMTLLSALMTGLSLMSLLIGVTVPGAFGFLCVGTALAVVACLTATAEPRWFLLSCVLLVLNLLGMAMSFVSPDAKPAANLLRNDAPRSSEPAGDRMPLTSPDNARVSPLPSRIPSASPRPDDPRIASAVQRCKSLIRRCQLADGALRMNSDGTPAWIEPYFASYGALGLLAGSRTDDQSGDLERVAAWLKWYVSQIDPEIGVPPEFNGVVTDYRRSAPPDSVDAYAGLFLMLSARHYAQSGNLSPQVRTAAVNMLGVIEMLLEADGLTVAKLDFRSKYLMDNLEVYWGCREAEVLFVNLQDEPSAMRAQRIAHGIATGIDKFRVDDHFAFAITSDGAISDEPGLGTRGLANLFVLASTERPQPQLWRTLTEKYGMSPDEGNAAAAGLQWWTLGARQSAPAAEAAALLEKSLALIQTFDEKTYLNRLGVMVLALSGGDNPVPIINLDAEASQSKVP